MSRSVSSASGAAWVLYTYLDQEDEFAWDDFVGNLSAGMKAAFPSLDTTAEWLGREDKAILENRHAYIGVSEYMGLVSVWCVPKVWSDNYGANERAALAEHWAASVEGRAKKVLEAFAERLVKQGTFSNGESVYARAESRA